MFYGKSEAKPFLVYFFLIFLCIINLSNIKIAGLSDIMPMFDLMGIFYFAVFKNRLGNWFLFLMGIWSDALNGIPLGITSLCYILLCRLFEIANNRILVKENFDHIWRQFILFCVVFIAAKWLMISVFNGKFASPINVVIQAILSSLFYVPMHKIFDHLTKKFLEG